MSPVPMILRGKETLVMVRSIGIAAVVVGLAWTGLSLAQPSSPMPASASASTERYITVREEGKTPQRCKLLKTWHEPNGTSAFQVQVVGTGEMMTIVGSAPAAAGTQEPRGMSTRIFHWGRDNKPPVGSPIPPAVAPAPATPRVRVSSPTTQPAQNPIVPYPAPAPVVSRPSTIVRPGMPSQTTATPIVRVIPSPQRLADATPSPSISAPLLPQPFPTTSTSQSSKPTTTIVTPPPSRDVKSIPVSSVPAVKPTVIPVPARPPQTFEHTPSTVPQPLQPRLTPSAAGTVVSQAPCNACCQTTCTTCCPSPCNACCQSSCAGCTPPMRQSWIRRLFKGSSPCCEVACQPAPTTPAVASKPAAPTTPTTPITPVVKASTEPARPRDWRESWGKVEPWKGATQADAAKPVDVPVKRVTRAPARFDPPKQPDPLKDPAWFGDTAMKQKLANSKIPDGTVTPSPSPALNKALVQNTPRPSMPAGQPMPPVPPAGEMAALPPTQPRGRVVELPANESNAFWTPETPPKKDEQQQPAPTFNAFDRENGSTPPMAAGPQGPMAMPRPPMGPMAMGGPPMGPMGMAGPPMGPMAMPMPPRPPMMPPMVDTGVPSGMANAFTLAGTRRPIPADFGGTPQEPNGFGHAVPLIDAQGPPRPYVIPRAGTMPPPYPGMPNMPGMAPQGAMAVNPLMSVPPTPVASSRPAQSANGVPQLLATLKDSLYPSQREGAAQQLSEQNWHAQPQVVESLTKSARDDPAATVRAACVRALAHMRVNTTDVAALVQGLKNDRDSRVRHEAEEALNSLGITPAPRQDSGVRQASHK